MMMGRKKVRVNWTLSPQAYNLISKIAKQKGKSCSWLAERLIIQKMADPVEQLKAENRELAKQINENQKRIEDLKSEDESA